MEFTSIVFAVFYSIIFVLYWQVPIKNRNVVLLIANIFFYISFGSQYILVLSFVIVFSFFMARVLEQRKKKGFVLASITGTALLLVIFKYLGFVSQILNMVLGILGFNISIKSISIIAPLGISYYTFQAISYLVDVYQGKIKAEKDFVVYAVYISFFPLVLSGPIERAGNVIPQLRMPHNFDYQNAVLGLERVLWGCFKKLVIADNLAVYVNPVGNDIYSYSGFIIILANLGYTIQLYCDFSGYSDMAIGFAKMLNIQLKENFKTPYLSASMKEFWSRWHISLSGWLRDYIYIPIGGSHCSKIRGMINLMITFLISGIWHGAGFKYLIWGIMHGVLQCIEKVQNDIFKCRVRNGKIVKSIRIVTTFLIINFTWLPFWLPTTRSFLYAVLHMFDGIQDISTYIGNGIEELSMNSYMLTTLLLSFVILFVHDYKAIKEEIYDRFLINGRIQRNTVRICLLAIILCCNCVVGSNFIYFQY